MQTITLAKKLAGENLTLLAKLTGINVRTLRRIKSGVTLKVHHATAETIARALKK